MRADLDGLGDEGREIGSDQRLGVVDNRASFTGGLTLRFTHNVLVAHGKSFDVHAVDVVGEVGPDY